MISGIYSTDKIIIIKFWMPDGIIFGDGTDWDKNMSKAIELRNYFIQNFKNAWYYLTGYKLDDVSCLIKPQKLKTVVFSINST